MLNVVVKLDAAVFLPVDSSNVFIDSEDDIIFFSQKKTDLH